jgi:hypothetical protein
MIHDAVLEYLQTELTRIMITEVADLVDVNGVHTTDPTKAGVVKLGPLQGDPDPDVARISIEIYENDPDQEIKGSGVSATSTSWQDKVEEVECGGGITWRRRFTIKARCLLESTQEDLIKTKRIASTVRSRLERGLLSLSFSGVTSEGEYVSRPVFSTDILGEMYQAGGPPDAFDYGIKVRFDILTTEIVEVK